MKATFTPDLAGCGKGSIFTPCKNGKICSGGSCVFPTCSPTCSPCSQRCSAGSCVNTGKRLCRGVCQFFAKKCIAAECTDGETDSRSCSNNCGESGTQTRSCSGGQWGNWGSCSRADRNPCYTGGGGGSTTYTYTCNSKCTTCSATNNCCGSQTRQCPSSNPSLTASNITANSVRLSWTSSTNANRYQVQQCSGVCNLRSVWNNVGSYTTSRSKTITGLTPNTQYSFRVRAQRSTYTTYRYSNIRTSRTTTGQTSIQLTAPTISSLFVETTPSTLNSGKCETLATLKYTSPYRDRTESINIYNGINSAHSNTLTTTGNTTTSYSYQLKNTDLNSQLQFTIQTTQTPTNTNQSNTTQQNIQTPASSHIGGIFTITDTNNRNINQSGGIQGAVPAQNQHLILKHSNPTQKTNLNYQWSFEGEQPSYPQGTSSTSKTPVISFKTSGVKTITLTLNDRNITTDNTHNRCKFKRTILIGAQLTKLNTPNITTSTTPELTLNRQCTPVIQIGYTSNNYGSRIDTLIIKQQNQTIYEATNRGLAPDIRTFSIPFSRLQPNTTYTASLTSQAAQHTQTTSTPATLTFQTPSSSLYPSSDFTYTIEDKTIHLTNSTHSGVIHTYTALPDQISQTPSSITFNTYGPKTITLTTTLNNLSCIKSQSINLTPPQQKLPRIEQVVPIY